MPKADKKLRAPLTTHPRWGGRQNAEAAVEVGSMTDRSY